MNGELIRLADRRHPEPLPIIAVPASVLDLLEVARDAAPGGRNHAAAVAEYTADVLGRRATFIDPGIVCPQLVNPCRDDDCPVHGYLGVTP